MKTSLRLSSLTLAKSVCVGFILAVLGACSNKSQLDPVIGDAQKAFASNDWTNTISISEKLISLDKSRGEAFFLIARVRTRQGSADAAIDALESALVSGLPNKQVIVDSDEFLSLSQNPRFLTLIEKYEIKSEQSSSGKTRIKAGDIDIEL